MSKQIISKDKLLESGLHYGHYTKMWNPAMKPFIAMTRRGTHIINLEKTIYSLDNAYKVAKKIAERRGTFLFVGTTKQSSKTVRENAIRVGAFYIDEKWLGGTLTNFKTIQNSINKLRNLERLAKTDFEGYSKKEGIALKKQYDKLEKSLGGIKYMRRLPNVIFVASIHNETIVIKEAKKLGITIFGVADTNVNPYDVNFPIFGNDDANKAAALVTTVIADAIASTKGDVELAAYVDDDDVKLLGVEPKSEYKRSPHGRFNNKPRYNNDHKRPYNPENKPEVKKEEPTTPIKIEEVKPVIVQEDPKPIKEEVVVKPEVKKEEPKKATKPVQVLSGDEDIEKIFGIGKVISTYLKKHNITTVETLAKLNIKELDEKIIVELPGIGNLESKTKKMVSFSAKAKAVLKE